MYCVSCNRAFLWSQAKPPTDSHSLMVAAVEAVVKPAAGEGAAEGKGDGKDAAAAKRDVDNGLEYADGLVTRDPVWASHNFAGKPSLAGFARGTAWHVRNAWRVCTATWARAGVTTVVVGLSVGAALWAKGV